jgi:dGTPase
VVRLLRALVDAYAASPRLLPAGSRPDDAANSPAAYRAAVAYVGGMTDRFACERAIELLDWSVGDLPLGFDVRR